MWPRPPGSAPHPRAETREPEPHGASAARARCPWKERREAPSICATPRGTEGAGDASTREDPQLWKSVPQHGSSPSSPAGDGEVGRGAPQNRLRSRPPAGPRPLRPPSLPDNASGSAARLRTRPGTTPPPAILGPLLPGEPLPRGSSGCSTTSPLQQQAERQAAGGARPRPLPAPGAPPRARGYCGPPPRAAAHSRGPSGAGVHVRARVRPRAPRVRPAGRRQESG